MVLPLVMAAAMVSCNATSKYYEELYNPRSGYYTRSWDGERSYRNPNSRASDYTINQEVLDGTNASNSRIEISLGEQVARLYRVEGGAREVAVETAISTGREGSHTPVGEFSVLEKLPQKNSNLYGSWVDGTTGTLLQGDGDSRRPPSGGNPEFQGSPMPYWLRITPDGVGMHVGYVPNYPASHGCIRVPRSVQPFDLRQSAGRHTGLHPSLTRRLGRRFDGRFQGDCSRRRRLAITIAPEVSVELRGGL